MRRSGSYVRLGDAPVLLSTTSAHTDWGWCAVGRCARAVVNHVRPRRLRMRPASYNANSASWEVLIGIPICGNTCNELLCIDEADGGQIQWMKLYDIKRRVAANKRSGFTPRQRISQKKLNFPQNFGTMHWSQCVQTKEQWQKHCVTSNWSWNALAMENNLQKRTYQMVCCFSSYKETAKSKAKNREFSTWE
jgi:hypothetical protein